MYCCLFIAFSESTLNFERFEEKKKELHSLRISKIIDSKKRDYLMHERSCFWKPFWNQRFKNFAKFTEKKPVSESFFNKLAGLRPATFKPKYKREYKCILESFTYNLS